MCFEPAPPDPPPQGSLVSERTLNSIRMQMTQFKGQLLALLWVSDFVVLAVDSTVVLAHFSSCSCFLLYLVYTMIFFNGCCFTAVVPSVPFYLQFLNAPETFLGWVVSFYSLGQIMGSPIGGFLTSKLSSKKILTISSMLGFLSSSLYSTAPTYMWILYSRLLTGIR